MKRLASMLCLLALLVLSLPCAAQAVTITNAEDWNLYCLYIVQDSVPVYELTIQEIADGAEDLATGTDLTYVFTPIDTIASPIRVMPTGEQAGGKAEIAYWRAAAATAMWMLPPSSAHPGASPAPTAKPTSCPPM